MESSPANIYSPADQLSDLYPETALNTRNTRNTLNYRQYADDLGR